MGSHATDTRKDDGFPKAFAALLKSRGLKVPRGLLSAPPDAYARQPASIVERLARADDQTLEAQADKIANFAARRAARAKEFWDASPLVAELRRRGLDEPPSPRRVVGASFPLKKPLANWTDDEILEAARAWSAQGSE
jgi:hypothetical protein